jgi:hypothetical protein
VLNKQELWLVMEYASEGSLYECLAKKEKEITWHDRWRLAGEAAAAVDYVHKRNVLHRYDQCKYIIRET